MIAFSTVSIVNFIGWAVTIWLVGGGFIGFAMRIRYEDWRQRGGK